MASEGKRRCIRPIQVALGNGLTQNRNFNPYTDRLDGATLDSEGGPRQLAEGYHYDNIGNATLRIQYWPVGGFSETFEYDELNRLKVSAVGAQAQNFEYDDASREFFEGVGQPARRVEFIELGSSELARNGGVTAARRVHCRDWRR